MDANGRTLPLLTMTAKNAKQVELQASRTDDLSLLDEAISDCFACPRLVAWRESVGVEKRKAYQDQEYWSRPVPGFGPHDAAIAVIGLAPGAHGANRTGRVFTGDRSGEWLYRSLYRAGLAALPTGVSRDDGQQLFNTRIFSAVRCAPPDNKPTTAERDTCSPWFLKEMRLVNAKVYVALGSFAWAALMTALAQQGAELPVPRPKFGHGTEVRIGNVVVIGSYHPSQQNTFTGRLTEPMLDQVFARAAELGAQATSG